MLQSLLLGSLLMVAALVDLPPLEDHKFQRIFRHGAETHQINGFIGGLQAGKTIAGGDTVWHLLYVKLLTVPVQARGNHPEVWFVSKSYTLAEVMWDTFRARHPEVVIPREECKKLGLKLVGNVHWLYPNVVGELPIRVRVRTASDPENLRASPNVIIIWADEIAHWKEVAWFNLLGRGIATPTKYLITTTPKGKNWLYRDVYKPGVNGTDPSINIVTCRSADNPWASKSYLSRLERVFGKDYADQELRAMFTDNIGYVYPAWDRDKHMVKPPSMDPSFYKLVIAGGDPGMSDPYAVDILAKGHDGCWWMLKEFYRTGGSTSRWLPQFQSLDAEFGRVRWYVDKRRPSDILDLQMGKIKAQANIDVHAEDDRRTIPPMVAMVKELLRTDRLFIAPECEFTADEFEKYHYPDEADERERNTNDIPVDWSNHSMDALRYGICSVEDAPYMPARYRQGKDQIPKPLSHAAPKPFSEVPVSAYIAAQDKRFDEKEKMGGRQERRSRPRSRMRFS